MTSGNFKSVPIDSIWLDREKRQRRELTGIPELAESIQRVGLIHPPVIRQDGELIAGERRFTAVKELGWTHISVQYAEDLPPDELHVIELEENIRRVDISWQDQCRAVERYHELRKEQNPEWNSVKTAETLGMSRIEVQEKRAVAKELDNNTRVAEAPKYSVARNIVRRNTERRKASTLKEIEVDETTPEEPPVPFILADFSEWARTYDGEPFNLLHCDFPYGVNADKHDQGAAAAHGGYADTEEIYWQLIATLKGGMENVVAPSAHLIFWFSMDYYQSTFNALQMMGWHVNPFPLIWYKSDNSGILPDPNRGPRRIYETAFFASRGDRKIVQAVSNCFPAPVTKEVHMSEKALPMLKHFLRMAVDEYSSVLDPTCGSANALRAAETLGAHRVFGLERDPEFYERAKEHWNT